MFASYIATLAENGNKLEIVYDDNLRKRFEWRVKRMDKNIR